jgi:hypothetical protein
LTFLFLTASLKIDLITHTVITHTFIKNRSPSIFPT